MIKDPIVITGASRGIGREIAFHVSRECEKIALWATNQSLLEKVAQEILNQFPSRIIHIEAVDLADISQVKSATENTLKTLGGIRSVVNNAGVAHPGPFDELTIEEWDRLFESNMRSTFLVTHFTLPHVRSAGQGCYVNIASEVGRLNQANNVAYGASKFAVVGFSQGLALELAPQGIRVNTVAPGPVETDMWDDAVRLRSVAEGVTPEQFRQNVIDRIPTGNFPTVKDVAEAVTFLLDGDRSRSIVGNTILVTGGLTVF